ncbi:hypothetical protein HKD42_01695 [Altererythrobacter sp. RZ02]|uniref:Ferrochelatase n=1 Tax=Pontixanthobacter rizhaonensis TaxID=2730337 RepID=A0A848QB85_9SPHN|nr:hypothetical protein [Pontixanthobacter rizhaonensis]NMW30771.1 hypothetical protein [Pontixanthobacter rizhaonensis]
MKFRNALAATAAVTLVASPAVAQSVQAERTAAPVEGESELGGKGGAGIILALLAAAAIIAGIVIAGDNNDDDVPVSP